MFRVVAETTTCAMFIHQGERYLYANPAGEALTGYTREELLAMNFWEIVHPDFQALVRERGRARQQGEAAPSQYELKIVTKGGQERWLNLSAGYIRFKKHAAVLGIAYDITERKQAEEALKRSEERYRRMIETASEGIWIIDAQARTTYVNSQMTEILGYTSEEMLGRLPCDFVFPEDLNEAMLKFNEKKQGIKERLDYRLRRKDGSEIWTHISTSPIFDNHNEFVGVLGMFMDITERKRVADTRARLYEAERRARADAEAANHTKDEFLATLSHELRTPLNALLGWSRLLRTGQLDEETAAQAIAAIERNAQSQAQLIEDLLDVSRIITGKLRLNIQAVDLASVINAAIDVVRPAAAAKGIRLSATFDPEVEPIRGDPDRLQQIVWNLLSNAVKFTARDGSVDVRMERRDPHITLTVRDTGQGIHPDFLPHVFDRFRQADSSTARAHGGLGLGLAIVRHLVELHGGTAHVASPGEEQGATFTVQLPFMVPSSEKRPTASAWPTTLYNRPLAERWPLKGVRVLIVDDDSDGRTCIALMLRQWGALVTEADSVPEALAAIERQPPDLLISDIGMPGDDGYELIRKVRARECVQDDRLPAMALTGYARIEDRDQVLSAGYQKHVSKPVHPDDLLKAIVSLTERTRQASRTL